MLRGATSLKNFKFSIYLTGTLRLAGIEVLSNLLTYVENDFLSILHALSLREPRPADSRITSRQVWQGEAGYFIVSACHLRHSVTFEFKQG